MYILMVIEFNKYLIKVKKISATLSSREKQRATAIISGKYIVFFYFLYIIYFLEQNEKKKKIHKPFHLYFHVNLNYNFAHTYCCPYLIVYILQKLITRIIYYYYYYFLLNAAHCILYFRECVLTSKVICNSQKVLFSFYED